MREEYKIFRELYNTKLTKDAQLTFFQNHAGEDLYVTGSELDDQQESVGNEDEENDYYSLGGGNHNDLEEDKGE